MSPRIVTSESSEYSKLDPYRNYVHNGVITDVKSSDVVGDWITIGSRRYNVHPPNGVNLHAYGIRWDEAALPSNDWEEEEEEEEEEEKENMRAQYRKLMEEFIEMSGGEATGEEFTAMARASLKDGANSPKEWIKAAIKARNYARTCLDPNWRNPETPEGPKAPSALDLYYEARPRRVSTNLERRIRAGLI